MANVESKSCFQLLFDFCYKYFDMKHILTKILLYTLALMYLPLTLVRVLVSFTLLVDAWCDKTINEFLEKNAKN